MGRIADIFTNGEYSRRLNERNAIARSNVGSSGYSKAQSESMKMARDLARNNISRMQGQAQAQNLNTATRAALAVQQATNLPADSYDLANSLNQMQTQAANQRVARAQADAMNAQEQLMRSIYATGTGIKTGSKIGSMRDAKQAADEQKALETNENARARLAQMKADDQNTYDAAVGRIKEGKASDDDLRLAYSKGYKGGTKTQEAYKQLGLGV